MTDYVKISDYAAKDALLTGNPAKLVKGTEIGADFDAVAVAVATKADSADPTFTGVASFPDGSAAAPSITNTGDVNTGIFFPAADTVAVSTGGSERMRIDATGKVGVGVSGALAYTMTIGAASNGINYDPAGSGKLSFLQNASANGEIDISSAGFITLKTGVGFTERMRIDASGDAGLGVASVTGQRLTVQGSTTNSSAWAAVFRDSASANLAYFRNDGYTYLGKGAAIIDSSGNVGIGVTPTTRNNTTLQIKDGIGFPATQVASSDANTLDDYEEGDWLGTLTGTTTNPTTPVQVYGKYTKIGRVVTASIGFGAVNTTGASGGITVSGLPWAAVSGSVGSAIVHFIATWSGSGVFPYVEAGTSSVSLFSCTSASTWVQATHNAGTSRYLYLTITYQV